MIAAVNALVDGVSPVLISQITVCFVDYLKHFISCEMSCKYDPFLLNLDCHKTHLSIPATNMAKKNGIFTLSQPPHTSYKLQPMDSTVFGSYKSYYSACTNDMMLSDPGKVPNY